MRFFCAALVVCGIATVAAQSECPPNPTWSYKGQDTTRWVEHWPTCGSGRAQSPINIPAGIAQKPGPAIEFHYQPFDLVVENNSHVIEVPATKGGYIVVDGHRYDLQQFHFHTPSEHRIGGRQFAMEIHFVHRDAAGRLAVIAVLADEKVASSTLLPIVRALPVAACSHSDTSAKLDASTLLPATRGYFTYAGSLTTPACTEGVTWLVLSTPISMSASQRKALGPLGPTARPVQPRNGRPITRVR